MKMVWRNISKAKLFLYKLLGTGCTNSPVWYNQKGALWFASDLQVNYECLVFVQMNPFNVELKTRIVTKVCRHSDVRLEILTVLCDYESTSESVACVLLFASETKSTAWYKKLLPSVHKSKFIFSVIPLHFLLYNLNTAVPNLNHIYYILFSILALKFRK